MQDVAVDAGGNVYVMDEALGLTVETNAGSAIRTMFGGMNGAAGVAVDGSGKTYVRNTVGGNITIYDSTGALVQTIPDIVENSNSRSTGIAVDSKGAIYVAEEANSIRVYDSSGTLTNTMALPGYTPLKIAVH